MTWSRARRVRYAHHVLLPDVGGLGQDRLGATRAAIAVDGRAGQVAAVYLAAGGVGTIVLCGGAAPAPAAWPFAGGGGSIADGLRAAIAARNPEVAVEVGTEGLAIDGDDPALPLAAAFARGGEAAARWLHAWATGAPR